MPNTLRNPVSFAKHRPRSPRTQPSRPELPPVHDDGAVFSVVDQIKAYRRPMSVAELAPILGRSEDALYRMVDKGDIPTFQIPGSRKIVFDPSSIVFWLMKHNPILKQVQKAS